MYPEFPLYDGGSKKKDIRRTTRDKNDLDLVGSSFEGEKGEGGKTKSSGGKGVVFNFPFYLISSQPSPLG